MIRNLPKTTQRVANYISRAFIGVGYKSKEISDFSQWALVESATGLSIENKFTRTRAHFTLGKNCVRFFTDFSADARSEI